MYLDFIIIYFNAVFYVYIIVRFNLFYMSDFYEYSTPELIRIRGSRFKEYRMWTNMTQKELAEQSGVSDINIHKLETGASSNISMANLLMLIKAIGKINESDTPLPYYIYITI